MIAVKAVVGVVFAGIANTGMVGASFHYIILF
jgi:hypothetical protein